MTTSVLIVEDEPEFLRRFSDAVTADPRLHLAGAVATGRAGLVLPLALAAQAEGCSVVFATGPEWSGWLRGHGLEAWSMGSSHEAAGGNRQASWLAYFARTAHARIDEALAVLSRATDADAVRTHGACLYNRGRVAEAENNPTAARTFYQRSLAVRPNPTVEARLRTLTP